MRTFLTNLFFLSVLMTGLDLTLTDRVTAQSYPKILGYYLAAETALTNVKALGHTTPKSFLGLMLRGIFH
jgi:hypothetical protein